MIEHKTHPVADTTLHRLLKECQEQLRTYVQRVNNQNIANQHHNSDDSTSCTEIVTHASRGNNTAFDMLLQVITPLIRQKIGHSPQVDVDDSVQNVSLRLLRRFRNHENPYQTTTFAAFRTYLNLTIRSVVINTVEREKLPNISVDQLQSDHGIEPAEPSAANAVETTILLDDLLALLSDPLERDALRRRYIYQETPAEIAQVLQQTDPSITKQDVYRYVERGLRRLVNHPLVQKLKDEINS